MKKICIILPTRLPVPAVKGGAVETLAQNLIDQNELDHRYDLTVICIHDGKAFEASKKYKHTRFLMFSLDQRLYSKVVRKISGLLAGYPLSPEAVAAAAVLNDAGSFDFVIVDGGDINAVFHMARYCPKERLLLHTHGTIRPDRKLDQVFSWLITVSNFTAIAWSEATGRPLSGIKVLKNCVDVGSFLRRISRGERMGLRETLGFSEDDFVIMFTGRIIEEKGVKELIQAVNRIEDRSVALLIIGSSNFGEKTSTPYENEIQKLILESDKKIKFTGYIHNSELYRYHQISDIAAAPSMCEDAAPLVPIEAMASGLPLIITRTGGMPEYAPEGTALIVEKDDKIVENLAWAIESLRKSPQLREEMAEKERELASSCDARSYFSNFCKVIEEIEMEKRSDE
jgi:spore coat protein SA